MNRMKNVFDGAKVRFYLKRSEPLIIVRAWVNGKGPFNFVVDTGASLTVISPSVAKRANIQLNGTKAKASGVKGQLSAVITKLKSISVGAVESTNLQVAILSLGSINRSTRLQLGGIIGYNFLKRYCITIDYRNKLIYFQVA